MIQESASPEPARSVKSRPEIIDPSEVPVAEVILDDGTFVSLYKWKAIHLVYSVHENQMIALANMLSMRTTFDGKQKTVPELLNLYLDDWNRIANTAMRKCN
jgi:hypothetical protein